MPTPHDPYRYYIGPWQWTGDSWTPPVGSLGAIDLRSVTDQGIQTLSDRPFGFFVLLDSLNSDYTLIGEGDLRELQISNATKNTWNSLMGYRPDGNTLLDLLVDQLTNGSDPDGAAGPCPLLPTVYGDLELHLGGHSKVWSHAFHWGDPFTQNIQKTLHRAYNEAEHISLDHARRVLDYWCDKYKLDKRDGWKELVPPEKRKNHPGVLPHQTTITDNFNRADGAIGSSSEGWSWTAVTGAWNIVSNEVEGTGANRTARAETDLSSSDHYSQVDIASTTANARGGGAACRFDSAANTCYIARVETATGAANDVYRIAKIVAAVLTELGTGVTSEYSAPDTVRIDANGSAISFDLNGVLQESITDTAISSGTRCGMFADSGATTTKLDNFSAADLTVTPAPSATSSTNPLGYTGGAAYSGGGSFAF